MARLLASTDCGGHGLRSGGDRGERTALSEMPRRLTRTIRRAGSHAGESSHQAPETESELTTLTGSSRTRGPYGETIGRLGPVADQTPSVADISGTSVTGTLAEQPASSTATKALPSQRVSGTPDAGVPKFCGSSCGDSAPMALT